MALVASCAGAPPDGLMPPHKLATILSHRNATTTHCHSGKAGPSIGFVGVGKAGSLFLQTVLELWAHEDILPTAKCGHYTPARAAGARMGWHHASAALWSRAFGTAWADAFTFSVVRNPWSRLVSHWAFHLQRDSNHLDGGHLTPSQRLAARANETESIRLFRSWVRHAKRVHPPGASDEWRFTTADAHGNEAVRSFNASQTSWLVDERGEQLIVKAVFKLEELEARWPELQASVCGLRGISYRDARAHPLVAMFDHPSPHAPFAEYYDEETSSIVAEYMAADIRRFDYSPPQLSAS